MVYDWRTDNSTINIGPIIGRLLVRGYQNSQEICNDLDFDKTNDLGGYEIRAIIHPTNMDKDNPNLKSVTGNYRTNAHYRFRALNLSKISVYEPSYDFSDIMHHGVINVNLMEWYQQNDFNTSMTYPHGFSGLQSQINKLLFVLDYSSRYAVLTVFATSRAM